MTARRSAAATAAVLVVSLIVAVTFSEGALISVRVWLTASVVGLTLVLVVRLVDAAELEPARLIPAWRRNSRSSSSTSGRGVTGLRATEACIANATAHPRVHANRLRPRLIALAEHHHPSHRPDDPHEMRRLADGLGDLAWLVDPNVKDRAPTLDEITRFLDLVVADVERSSI